MLIAGDQVDQLLIPPALVEQSSKVGGLEHFGNTRCPFISLIRVDNERGELSGMRYRVISLSALSAKSLKSKVLTFTMPLRMIGLFL